MSEADVTLELSVSGNVEGVLDDVQAKLAALSPKPRLCPRRHRFAGDVREKVGVLRGFHVQGHADSKGKCA